MNTLFECPICNIHTIRFYSCDQCLKTICQTCHQNIIQSDVLQKSCPFCRKEFVSSEIATESKIMDILYQAAIHYFVEDMDLETAITSSIPNNSTPPNRSTPDLDLPQNPTSTNRSPNLSRFQESIQLGYLIGTGIYFFRQIFRTQ